jgi:hypothetical protein
MTLIDRIESLSARFLSERTHELIVVPAIADVQHDASGASDAARGRLSVLVAFAGAAYEEVTSDLQVVKIAALALIPALYYAFLVILVVPEASAYFVELAVGVAVLSLAPVLACCWPERTSPRATRPDVADA